jgi:hypothetical protein
MAGRTVPDPLTPCGDDRLAGSNFIHGSLRFHSQYAAKYQGVFVEFRGLSGLDPSGRALHASDTNLRRVAVYQTDKFLNTFRLVSCSLNDGGSFNLDCHKLLPLLRYVAAPYDQVLYMFMTLKEMGVLNSLQVPFFRQAWMAASHFPTEDTPTS